MKYVNQLEYPDIPYLICTASKEFEGGRVSSVARSGCGLSSVCMMVDMLTAEHLDIRECVKISEECDANHLKGTDIKILAPIIAEKFGLEYTRTNDLGEAISHIQRGGQIIVLVAVPQGEEIGIFTKGWHYMLICSTDGKELCILDPAYTPDKYLTPERVGKVDISHAPYLYCDANILDSQARAGDTGAKYHMFARKR